jgi:hypothetical protein
MTGQQLCQPGWSCTERPTASCPSRPAGRGTHKLIPGSEYVAIDGADLGLCWTHAGEVNAELLRFFK